VLVINKFKQLFTPRRESQPSFPGAGQDTPNKDRKSTRDSGGRGGPKEGNESFISGTESTMVEG